MTSNDATASKSPATKRQRLSESHVVDSSLPMTASNHNPGKGADTGCSNSDMTKSYHRQKFEDGGSAEQDDDDDDERDKTYKR